MQKDLEDAEKEQYWWSYKMSLPWVEIINPMLYEKSTLRVTKVSSPYRPLFSYLREHLKAAGCTQKDTFPFITVFSQEVALRSPFQWGSPVEVVVPALGKDPRYEGAARCNSAKHRNHRTSELKETKDWSLYRWEKWCPHRVSTYN